MCRRPTETQSILSDDVFRTSAAVSRSCMAFTPATPMLLDAKVKELALWASSCAERLAICENIVSILLLELVIEDLGWQSE